MAAIDAIPCRETVLERIASCGGFFKSQQRGEPDLTFDDKKRIAGDILDRSPSLFLFRFGKSLSFNDLSYFDRFNDDYEVNFYLKELFKRFDEQRCRVVVKNRRYEALKELMKKGDYFSDAEMKKRNPLLYEQMIGQYLNEEEREEADKIDKEDLRFSTILMDHIERDHICSLRIKQQNEEDGMLEENDSDDEDDAEYIDDNSAKTITDQEKHNLRQEFVSNMQENFLMGKDVEFDYSGVDDNENYDNCENSAEEDKYFDSEEPENVNTTDETRSTDEKIESDET